MKNYPTESIVPAILFISAYPTGLYPVLKMKNFQKGATGKIVTSDFYENARKKNVNKTIKKKDQSEKVKN